MRLSDQNIAAIRDIVREETRAEPRVRVFGSRLNDKIRGGDLDLLVEADEALPNPAWMVARIEARVSRLLGGRSVDVVLSAPNLRRLQIHDIARREGILL